MQLHTDAKEYIVRVVWVSKHICLPGMMFRLRFFARLIFIKAAQLGDGRGGFRFSNIYNRKLDRCYGGRGQSDKSSYQPELCLYVAFVFTILLYFVIKT